MEERKKFVTVVDARMGRGKSSAAIRYMNRHKGRKRFLYITPYLDEVSRICECCDFDQSDSDHLSKSTELKRLMYTGANIAATHSLFLLMDDEALGIAKAKGYSLIIDESIRTVFKVGISYKDEEIILSHLADEDECGLLSWRDPAYEGKFEDYKHIADTGSLFHLDSAIISLLNPKIFEPFDEIFVLTYMFEGQYIKAYLEYFDFEYKVVGVEQDMDGYFFSDKPDRPGPIDYRRLINLVARKDLNKVGRGAYSLSKNWYKQRGYGDKEITALRNGMRTFFKNIEDGDSNTRLWTCFKDDKDKLVNKKTGRYKNNFLQVSSRATNEYRDKTDVAYMVNRFSDPNLSKFFAQKGVYLDAKKFALSEMLQWIWRSAIRDDKPINLYVPSERMRNLLIEWMDEMRKEEQE